MTTRRLVREILSRPDPQGYYVLLIDARLGSSIVEELKGAENVVIDEAGDTVIVRTRSRSLAARIAEKALRLGALKLEA